MQLQNRLGIRALFFDLDGTLISFRDSRVPDSAKAAIREAKAMGVRIFAASGRHKLGIRQNEHLAELPFDGFVALNGQYCYTPEEVIYRNPIPKADLVTVSRYADELGPCLFLTGEQMYITRIDERVQRLHRQFNMPRPIEIDARDAVELDVLQMSLYVRRGVVPEGVRRLEHCHYAHWQEEGMDIYPRSGNKWLGICHTLKHFGISPARCAVFGDSDNDVDMMRSAVYSVAMGVSSEAVRAAATHHTTEVEKDGIQNAIHRLLA